ncbi:MAG: PilZ domain-containing protein [Planctomycetes bacterium]|nr:PilZ domain-containing protein [Planctomycetota bacterium]
MDIHITFLCPACGKEVKASAAEAGTRCFCPHCSAEMLVPFIKLNGVDRQKALDLLASKGAERGFADRAKEADRRDSARWGAEGIWAHIEGRGPYRVINISSGGVAVEIPVEETSQLGRMLTVQIDNPFQGGKLTVSAQVVWLTLVSAFDGATPVGNGLVADRTYVRMGMSFVDVPLNDKKILEEIRCSISH